MWPAISKKLNPDFKMATAFVDPGRGFMRLPPKRWKNTKQTFDAGGWIFSGTRRSWKDSTAPVSALKGEVTRLTGKKPAKAIKEEAVYFKHATSYHRPVGV